MQVQCVGDTELQKYTTRLHAHSVLHPPLHAPGLYKLPGLGFPCGFAGGGFFLQGEQQRCFQRDKKMLCAKLYRKGINRCWCTEFMVISQASEKPKVQPPQLVLSHAVSAVPQ